MTLEFWQALQNVNLAFAYDVIPKRSMYGVFTYHLHLPLKLPNMLVENSTWIDRYIELQIDFVFF